MKEPRVTIKESTLRKIRDLVVEGDYVEACELITLVLDPVRNDELRKCKEALYLSFRKGKRSYEEYRRLMEFTEEKIL